MTWPRSSLWVRMVFARALRILWPWNASDVTTVKRSRVCQGDCDDGCGAHELIGPGMGDPEDHNLFLAWRKELVRILKRLGMKSIRELVGRHGLPGAFGLHERGGNDGMIQRHD